MIEGKIGFIGVGSMGAALVYGLIRSGAVPAERVVAFDPVREQLEELVGEAGIRAAASNRELVEEVSVVVLAVKPQVMDEVLAPLAGAFTPDHLVVSIAAGIPTSFIEARVGEGVPVVRAMPNTPALLGVGAAAYCLGRHAVEAHGQKTSEILRGVGTVIQVPEAQMDVVTALSGSGPAYFFLLTEVLVEAAIKQGLPRSAALELACQTALGAARMMMESETEPALLRRHVTSPGGTTEAALSTLGRGGFDALVTEAIATATRRSRELSD